MTVPGLPSGGAALRLLRLFAFGVWLLLPSLVAAEKATTLRVGVYENSPLLFQDPEGQWKGLAITVLEETAVKEGWRIDYRPGTWSECLERLARREIDLLAAIAYSPERARLFDFNGELLINNWGALYVSRNSGIEALSDIQGRKIAVLKNDIYVEIFRKYLEAFGVEAELVELGDYHGVFALVRDREVDAGLANRTFGMEHEADFDLQSTSIIFNPVEVRFAAPKGMHPQVLADLDRHLQRLKENPGSSYHRSLEQWFRPVGQRKIPLWLRWSLPAASGGLLLFLFASLWLQRQVRRRTAELSERNRELEAEMGERQLAEAALRESEEKFRALVEHTHDVVARFDRDFRYLYINPACTAFRPLAPPEYVGRTHDELGFPPETNRLYEASMDEVFRTGRVGLVELKLPLEAGRIAVFECRIFPEFAPDGSVTSVVSLSRDISERRRAEEQIEKLAYYDSLTGLPNRTLLKDRLGQVLAQARRDDRQVAVLFLDLDRFKGINDTLGHECGDLLLKAVAERLQECVRSADTVARLGGDEFVLILPAVHKGDGGGQAARKVLESLSVPYDLDGQEVYCSSSIGIALFPMDGEDVDALLKNADTAMYVAKERGRSNFQFFSREMNQRAVERLVLESRLRRALDREELRLYYQPQVDLREGRVIGVEALLRWELPGMGLISPARFIPIAEETGLIGPIGAWVLETACMQVRSWHQAGLSSLRVAVNLSGRQLVHSDLVGQVTEALERSGLPPEFLELELTESILMEHPEKARKSLQKLKDLGVLLAIDDFGTGYSSLNYLKHFPLDRLKIAGAFVRDIPGDSDDAAIAEAVIAMAHSLRLEVIAEEVESLEQVDFLVDRHCHLMQGYFFGKPVPAEALPGLIGSGIPNLRLCLFPAGRQG